MFLDNQAWNGYGVMTRPFDEFQSVIGSPSPDIPDFIQRARQLQQSLTGLELARAHVVLRLATAWRGLAKALTGPSDLAVLLRQLIRTHEERVLVPDSIWHLIKSHDERSGLRANAGDRSGWVELQADDWNPTWLPGAQSIDQIAVRRFDEPTVGDGTLQALMGKAYYTSGAQKVAVEACQFAPSGSTTLVSLPTGAGKSLCALLPAWRESAGGRIAGGSTIVVVPTVSLALDQHERASQLFPMAAGESFSPQIWTSDTEPNLRAAIRRGLLAGSLPILYTSPEALMSSSLLPTCMEAAANGRLTRFIIDEAHIVQSWGGGFRTEFQFLASLRRRMREAGQGKLRTVLLSATVTAECEELLGRLFAEPGNFIVVRANRLRPEPSYWFARCPSEELRQQRVLEAFHYLPRPAILYVTQPDTANNWASSLRSAGFMRTRAYTGQTSSADRRSIQEDWRGGDIDLIVATSAFGLGVDKSDVRTVVHACLPENVDRFYQEVGRGGRDGNAAISLLCTTEMDQELPTSMSAAQVIGSGKAVSRWQGMRRGANSVPGNSELLLVDTDSPPQHDLAMQSSDRNREWNEHTLLLFQRAGLISIADTRSTDDVTPEATPNHRLQVKLIKSEILADPVLVEAEIDNARERERARISNEIHRMERIASAYASSEPPGCISQELTLLYPDCGRACGGCPTCRAKGIRPFAEPLEFLIESNSDDAELPLFQAIAPRLAERFAGGPLNLFWTDPTWLDTPHGLAALISELLTMGVTQLVIPDELLKRKSWVVELVRQLASNARQLHCVVPGAWIETHPDITLRRCPTAVVYPTNMARADNFHIQFREHSRRELETIQLIRVVQEGLYLHSEHGLFRDRIDGTPEDAASFQDWLNVDELDSF